MNNKISSNINADANSFTKQAIQNAMRDLNVCKPGRIESFDKIKQTATVTIMIQSGLQTVENGKQVIKPIDIPILIDCPVLIMQGSNGYLNVPINAGDPCIVIFSDRDIDDWYLTNQKLPPATSVLHNIKDGFVIVGFNNAKTAFADYDNSFSLKYKNAQVGISEDGKLLAKNETTSLLQVLKALIQAILQMQIMTQGQAFVVQNTPGAIDTATASALQEVLQKLDGLME